MYIVRLCVILIVGCFSIAVATTFSNVVVREITYSTATIQWTLDPAGGVMIKYGLDASYGKTMTPLEGGPLTSAVYYISGLSAATKYHFAVCTGEADCSEDYTFETEIASDPSPRPPNLPQQVKNPEAFPFPRLPIIDGNSYTVNEDCSNLQDLIVTAAAIEGPLNHEITIPASADCSHIGVVNEYHAWVLPSRSESSTGEIVIRTSDADQLPPQGTRVTPEYRAHMPTIRANAWGLGDLYSTECIVGKYWWSFLDINDGNWGLKRCVAENPDSWETVARTDFEVVAPSTCTPDSWYYNTSASLPARGVFYCAPNSRLYPMRMSNIQSFAVLAGAHHYRLLGLHFNVVPFPNPPPDYWSTHYTMPGSYYKGWWFLYHPSHHIVFDRCLFVGAEYPMRVQSGIYGQSNYLAVLDSWFENVTYWLPSVEAYGCNPCTASAIQVTGGSFMKLINNYIDATGINLFASDDADQMTSDVEVLRNHFVRQEKYRLGSQENTDYTGKYYQSRHLIELKRGLRWLIEGNIFDHNFLALNQGGAVVLSNRAGSLTNFSLSDISVVSNHFMHVPQAFVVTGHNPGAYNQYQPGQRFEFSNNLVHNVSAAQVAAGAPLSSKGLAVLVQLGVEDLTFTHNTIVDIDPPGYWPAAFWFSDGISSGLLMRDNILELRWGDGYGGIITPGLLEGTASFDGGFPNWQCDNNVFVNVGQRDPARYPSDNYWANDTLSLFGGDYQLEKDSPFGEGAPLTSTSGPASDGTDVGVNHKKLRLAMGVIEDTIEAQVNSAQLTVSFTGPDTTTPCFLDVATDASFSSYVRSEGSLQNYARLLTAGELKPSTTYYYRVWCFRGYEGQITTSAVPTTSPMLSSSAATSGTYPLLFGLVAIGIHL